VSGAAGGLVADRGRRCWSTRWWPTRWSTCAAGRGVGAGFAWQLPPLLAAAVAWPVLLLVGPPHQQPSGRQRGV